MSIDAGSFKRPELKPIRRIREGAGPQPPEPPPNEREFEPFDSSEVLPVLGVLLGFAHLAWVVVEAVIGWTG